MIILLAGAAGQLGQELSPMLSRLGRLVAVDRQSVPGSYEFIQADLTQLGQTEIHLNRLRPDIIVNAAAYTAVDQAEQERDTAFLVNADLPGCLARWAARNQRLLVHYSTDYIFSGESTRPYLENDPPAPLNVYGESKLAGEEAIQLSGCKHLSLRASWVYSAHGRNFVLTMLKLAQQRSELSIVDDQNGCPTWARNLARASCTAIEQVLEDSSLAGTYHYCDRDQVSWKTFAEAIFSTARESGLLQSVPAIQAVDSECFKQPARRPAYSAMDTSLIQQTFGIQPPGLADSLKACLKGIKHI